LTTYFLQINEKQGRAYVKQEVLKYRRGSSGQPWHFLDFSSGKGTAVTNELEKVNEVGELSKKPWPVFKALRTVRKVCHIINDCHSEKICVGDLHAGNILVDSIGCIRIIDIDFEAVHNNEYAVQDVVSVSKLLYTLIGSADKLTDDLKKVLPMRADAIRNRYKSTQQVLDALDELMGK
jgi:serine/threonine protein kinase